jgi:hypothetical protein
MVSRRNRGGSRSASAKASVPAKSGATIPAKRSPPAKKAAASGRPRPQPTQSFLPTDLCSAASVAAGFALLEPINAPTDSLLRNTDLHGSAKALAGEAVAHLVEGWRYLSAATGALLANSRSQAIHLAYYAELRAAFTLFSCSGITISYPQHRYLSASGNVITPQWYRARTHEITWELWNQWTQAPYATDLFSDRLRVHPSIALRDISSTLAGASAQNALLSWGFDLLELRNDHDARNQASYEPTITKVPLTSMGAPELNFVREMWQLLQPTVTGLAFESAFVHYCLDIEIAERLNDRQFVPQLWYDSRAQELVANTGAPLAHVQALLQLRPYSTRLFELAANRSTGWDSVMARAVFLLRLATKAVEDAYTSQQNSPAKSWFINWLIQVGIVADANSEPRDVWDDFIDLPSFVAPAGSVPRSLWNDAESSQLASRLARPDASVAWSISL